MTETQNPRVAQALAAIESALIEQTGAWLKEGGCFNDAINFALDLTVSVQDALELARHREAAEAASKAREAELVEALKSAPLIGSTEHPHTFRCRQDVWLRDVFTPVLAALTKEPDA